MATDTHGKAQNLNTSNARKEYEQRALLESDVVADPLALFQDWYAEAVAAAVPEPEAMTLATCNAAGQPSARIVLLRGCDHRGFTFFTNYESRKGRELAHNPWASLLFWWPALERQVRIEGRVEKISAEESGAYFRSRPRGSQLGAWASAQSRSVASRAELEARMHEREEQFAEGEVPRPPHWGGFRLRPWCFEFWQGRPSRLHDRLRYSRQENGPWHMERLQP